MMEKSLHVTDHEFSSLGSVAGLRWWCIDGLLDRGWREKVACQRIGVSGKVDGMARVVVYDQNNR